MLLIFANYTLTIPVFLSSSFYRMVFILVSLKVLYLWYPVFPGCTFLVVYILLVLLVPSVIWLGIGFFFPIVFLGSCNHGFKLIHLIIFWKIWGIWYTTLSLGALTLNVIVYIVLFLFYFSGINFSYYFHSLLVICWIHFYWYLQVDYFVGYLQ